MDLIEETADITEDFDDEELLISETPFKKSQQRSLGHDLHEFEGQDIIEEEATEEDADIKELKSGSKGSKNSKGSKSRDQEQIQPELNE